MSICLHDLALDDVGSDLVMDIPLFTAELKCLDSLVGPLSRGFAADVMRYLPSVTANCDTDLETAIKFVQKETHS